MLLPLVTTIFLLMDDVPCVTSVVAIISWVWVLANPVRSLFDDPNFERKWQELQNLDGSCVGKCLDFALEAFASLCSRSISNTAKRNPHWMEYFALQAMFFFFAWALETGGLHSHLLEIIWFFIAGCAFFVDF